MKIKYGVAFSGGYDSSHFLKNICRNKQAHKYVLINVYWTSEKVYTKTHFIIAQAAYEWNIAFKILKTNYVYCIKAKNRIPRINLIYTYLKEKKIQTLYVLLSHTDMIETFVMRVLNKTNTYGLCSIYCNSKCVFYKGFKICIMYPQIEKTRQEIIDNTYRLCEDSANQPNSNTRNIIREKINIGKYYSKIVYLILFLKALDVMNKYTYCAYTQILKTKIQDNYFINSDDLKNIILKGTRILYFQTKNTVKKHRITLYKNQDVNKCHVNIVDNEIFIKLNDSKILIERKICKTIILLNYIHKIEIYHPKFISVNFKKYYSKAFYKKLNKCFQKNIEIIINNQTSFYRVKITNLNSYNCNICESDQIYIRQIVIQKNFYK